MATSLRPRRRRPLHTPIRTKGVITLPLEVREELGLHEGDEVIVSVHDGAILLTPARVVPRDQEWFWTSEWQRGERQADREVQAGHGRTGHTFDEFIADLTASTNEKI